MYRFRPISVRSELRKLKCFFFQNIPKMISYASTVDRNYKRFASAHANCDNVAYLHHPSGVTVLVLNQVSRVLGKQTSNHQILAPNESCRERRFWRFAQRRRRPSGHQSERQRQEGRALPAAGDQGLHDRVRRRHFGRRQGWCPGQFG